MRCCTRADKACSTSGTLPTRYTYTGQYSYASDFGLVFYGSRFYDPLLSRWASPDSIIPQNQGTLAWDRYSYVFNNPVKYSDPSGHFPWLVVAAIVVTLKVIDYGWTAYDAWQSTQVLRDPNSSSADKALAAANVAVTVAFEAAEPDDFLPISLPIDDIVRHSDDISDALIRAVPSDQVGTSQPFKTFRGEDGLSVFEGVSPDQVLSELPGIRVPNTTVSIPASQLPSGTQIVPTPAECLSKFLSDAHRILLRPEGWSADRFARELKKIVGWE